MDLPAETLARVARLARLPLDEADLERFQRDVGNVLSLFETLEEHDADAPSLPEAGGVRDDVVEPWAGREALLANVPRKDEAGRIKVGRWE